MPLSFRFLLALLVTLLLCQCASTPEDDGPLGEPKLEKLEHAKLDATEAEATSLATVEEEARAKARAKAKEEAEVPSTGLAPVAGKEGRMVIRDAKGAMRVEGVLKGGRMDGLWKYFDPNGRKLGEVTYRGDQRHGPVTLYFVSKDGKAAGKKKMTGVYDDGSLNGFARNFYGQGGKHLEREFDRGILQSVRGWKEDGKEMTDGEAQSAGLQVSQAEDALLSELEAFVQLKIRQNASGGGADS
jgi:antitoxin component YwqK of YwqJK toxin-antitoxin module